MPERIIIISGATATGKSNLALQIAESKDIAIINADSLQLYQGLPILSSQPNENEKKQVPHFLYSCLKPQESNSVGSWLKLIKSIVLKVEEDKKIAIIVGGSGMYISKLIDGISIIPEIDDEIKTQAKKLYEATSHEEFQQRFGERKIVDKQRLIRACEVLLQTKKPISFWQNQPNKKIFPQVKFLHINLELPREELYKNCNLRFEKMLKNGAIEEVKNLVAQDFSLDLKITKTLGFCEIYNFINEKISDKKMLEIATQKTRNYAKRQLTWFRHQLPQKFNFQDPKAALNFLKNEI
jgi:tRNA dimethylallyltransferase